MAVSDKQVVNQLGNSPNHGVCDRATFIQSHFICLVQSLGWMLLFKFRTPSYQVSDDEDDTHPNIDTPSLFKWRHEARVQRMQEFEEKKKSTEQELSK